MATAPPEDDPRNSAFVREVDDELQRERLNQWWRRWGRWLIVAVLLALASLGGWLWWQAERERRAERGTEALYEALRSVEGGDPAAAAAQLQAAAEGRPVHRGLAELARAGLLRQAGDLAGALGIYRALAGDAGLPRPLRDLAALTALRLELDTLPPAEMLARLEPWLAGDGPFFAIAAEMAAALRMEQGDEAAAGRLWLRIAADEQAPQGLRGRAEQLAALVGEDTSALAPELAPAPPAAPPAAAPAAPPVAEPRP